MTFNQYNVTTITEPYTASNEEYIISDGSTVTLPEPRANAIVAVASRDGTRVPVEPNATELVEFDSFVRVGTTGATYFVSDGTNWYLESGRENVFGEIPDSGLTHDWLLDEGAGSDAFDSSGDADLSLTGASWISGIGEGGYVLDFGETDDRATATSGVGQYPDYTFGLWVYFNSINADNDHDGIMSISDGGTQSDERNTHVVRDTGNLSYWDRNTSTWSESDYTPPTGQWEFYVWRVSSNNSVQIFVNGDKILDESRDETSYQEFTQIDFGLGDIEDQDEFADIRIDRPRLHTTLLSDNDIQDWFDATKGIYE